MPKRKPNRPEHVDATDTAEPSSWWPYALLVVHLLLEATKAGAWALAWMAVPGAFFAASAGALFIASRMPVRERLTAIPAALLGYSPRERSRRRSTQASRESA
jgi:hypothetical protein